VLIADARDDEESVALSKKPSGTLAARRFDRSRRLGGTRRSFSFALKWQAAHPIHFKF
jgi:hypothetical protein